MLICLLQLLNSVQLRQGTSPLPIDSLFAILTGTCWNVLLLRKIPFPPPKVMQHEIFVTRATFFEVINGGIQKFWPFCARFCPGTGKRNPKKVIYLIILFLSREFYHLMPTLTRHTTSMGGKIHLLSKFFREKCPETSDHPISPPMHWGTWMYRPSWNSCMAHTSAHAPSGIDGSPGSSGSSSVFDFDWESADRRVLSQMFPEYAVQALCFFFNLVFNTQHYRKLSQQAILGCVCPLFIQEGNFLI